MRGRACGEAGIVRTCNMWVGWGGLKIAGRCPVWEARLGACSRGAWRDIRDQMGAWACLVRGRARGHVASRAGSLGTGEDCGRTGGQSTGGGGGMRGSVSGAGEASVVAENSTALSVRIPNLVALASPFTSPHKRRHPASRFRYHMPSQSSLPSVAAGRTRPCCLSLTSFADSPPSPISVGSDSA